MKIGFCFLIKNKIGFENLWKTFFYPANESEYSIYIHAKTANVCTILENVLIDLNPIETSWASISLVHATKRLLETAFNDGCESVIFLSGDTLPLWNFRTIQNLCSETLFSLQPKDGLFQFQINMNEREHTRIRNFYQLNTSIDLVKQNMFFSISKYDYNLIKDIEVSLFPTQEVPDEYFWANHLIIKGRNVSDSKFIFVNDDATKTQSRPWILDGEILFHARSKGYLFIRKVIGFSDKRTRHYFKNLIC